MIVKVMGGYRSCTLFSTTSIMYRPTSPTKNAGQIRPTFLHIYELRVGFPASRCTRMLSLIRFFASL